MMMKKAFCQPSGAGDRRHRNRHALQRFVEVFRRCCIGNPEMPGGGKPAPRNDGDIGRLKDVFTEIAVAVERLSRRGHPPRQGLP